MVAATLPQAGEGLRIDRMETAKRSTSGLDDLRQEPLSSRQKIASSAPHRNNHFGRPAWSAILLFLPWPFACLSASAAAVADPKEDCEKKSGDVAIQAAPHSSGAIQKTRMPITTAALTITEGRGTTGPSPITIAPSSSNPNYADAYNNRGNPITRRASTDRAIADYTRAIELNPNYADAYNNRGIAYKRTRASTTGPSPITTAPSS